MTVHFDDRGIDDRVFEVRLVRAGLEKPEEHAGFDPIAVTFEHRVPFAKEDWQVAPRRPRSDNPQHRLDKQPVVFAAAPGVRRLAQAVRLHLRPLGVGQNQTFHPKLESQPIPRVNPESQQALES